MKLNCQVTAYIQQLLSYIWQHFSVYNIPYKYTCIFPYLMCCYLNLYNITYLLHGADSFLRS